MNRNMSTKSLPWMALFAIVAAVVTGCGNAEQTAKPDEVDPAKSAAEAPKPNLTWDEAKQAYVEKREDGSIAYEGDKSGTGVFKMKDDAGRPVTLDRTGEIPISESGVAEYPGSTIPGKEPQGAVKLASSIMTQYNFKRATTDPAAKVVAFYKQECTITKEEKKDEKNAMIYQGADRGDVKGVMILTGKNKRGDDVDIRIIPAQEELKQTIMRIKVTLKGAKVPPKPKTATKATPTLPADQGDKTVPVPSAPPAKGGPTGNADQ